jgi:hypothetical protein
LGHRAKTPEGELAVAIHPPNAVQAEDIFGRGIRLRKGKRTEQAVACFARLFKAPARNLAAGGMDLLVVIPMDLFAEDRTRLFQLREALQDTGADDPILEPTIRTFHFAFGLRREGIGHIHLEHCLQLIVMGASWNHIK